MEERTRKKKHHAFERQVKKQHATLRQNVPLLPVKIPPRTRSLLDVFVLPLCFPPHSKEVIRAGAKFERMALDSMGLRVILGWQEDDQEKLEKAAKDKDADSKQEAQNMFDGWTKRKNEKRIRMPVDSDAEYDGKKHGILKGKPQMPRFDFSGGKKGVFRKSHSNIKGAVPQTTVDLMAGMGYKYVHAINKAQQGVIGDLEKSRQQLLDRGHVYKDNFGDDDDEYGHGRTNYKGKNANPKVKERMTKAEERKKAAAAHFLQWSEIKEMVTTAKSYLKFTDNPGMDDDPVDTEGHWEDVGRCLKAIDRSLLGDWQQWSKDYKSASSCKARWVTFEPKDEERGEGYPTFVTRQMFAKQIMSAGINLKKVFERECEKKLAKKKSKEGEDGGDTTLEEEMKSMSFTYKEFVKLLAKEGIQFDEMNERKVLKLFDTDGDGNVSTKEFLDVMNKIKRTRDSETDDAAVERREDALQELAACSLENRKADMQRKLISKGTTPSAPSFFAEQAKGYPLGDMTTQLFLGWAPSNLCKQPVAFFILETAGVEGSKSHKNGEWREVYRDPPSAEDESTSGHTIANLQPNTSYSYRLRAFNGHGPSPFTHANFRTAPSRPPEPKLLKASPTTVLMKYAEKSSDSSKQSELALRQLFQELDIDGNGDISRDELLEQIEDSHPKLLRLLRETKVQGDGGDGSEGGKGLSLFDRIEDNDNESISWEEFRNYFGEAFEGLFSGEATSSATGANSTRRKGKNIAQTVKTKFLVQKCRNEQKQIWETIYRGSATTHRVLGLQPGKPYRFRILTISAEGVESAPSNAVVMFTTLETPEPPRLSSQSPPTSTSIRLRWSGQAAVGGGSGTAGSTEGSRGASKKQETEKILSEWTNAESDDGGVNVRAAFARYDLDKDGTINLRPEFKLLLEDLGIVADDQKLHAAFEQFDENKDGHISLDEFMNWFNGGQRIWVLKHDRGVLNPLNITSYESPALVKEVYRDRRRQYEVLGLSPNTLYHFGLRATSATCQSSLSAPAAYMTAPSMPSAPVIVRCSASSMTVRWHPGQNGAARYRLQVKFVESLADAIAGGSGHVNSVTGSAYGSSSKQWKTAFEGSETIATAVDLLPDAVYRLRLIALNAMGNESEPSDVSQAHTFRRGESPKMRPSNAHEHFTVEFDRGVIVGDTILFTERLFKSDDGRLLNDARNGLNASVCSVASVNRRSMNASMASNMSQRGYNIGERTVAASVTRIIYNRNGETVLAYISSLMMFHCFYFDIIPIILYPTFFPGTQEYRLQVIWSTVSTKEASNYELRRDTKVTRKEKHVFEFETFRTRWADEEGRRSLSNIEAEDEGHDFK
jgi:Ca2+-binding EF-hand superfamily protein